MKNTSRSCKAIYSRLLNPSHHHSVSTIAPTLITSTWVLVAACAFGLLSLMLGMDANWDLRNYHYYLPYAFLQHRHGHDVLAAQLATFFNPTLDIPFFLAAEALPARLIGSGLGALHGVPFVFLLLLAQRTLAIDNQSHRAHVAGLIALVSTTGAVTLSEVGTVFYDNLLSTGFLASLLAIVAGSTRVINNHRSLSCMRLKHAFLAGLPVGFAAALKLPHIVAAFGACMAVLAVPCPLTRRLAAAVAFAAGVLASVALIGGWWHWHLWQSYGNPIFPAFNDIFQSSWGEVSSYRGNAFLPPNWWERLSFIFIYPFILDRTAEVPFRDLRITILFLILPIAVIIRLVRHTVSRDLPLVHLVPARCLLTAVTCTYLAWATLFAIYRYATSLEMLAPLASAVAISWLPLPRSRIIVIIVTVLITLIISTSPADWGRTPWADRYLEVKGIPTLPRHSMILMSGREALSFLIPAFPPQPRFIRIDSWFATPWQDNGFTRLVRHEINTHQGALFMLLVGRDNTRAKETATAYNLSIDERNCTTLVASISIDPYQLCYLYRELRM